MLTVLTVIHLALSIFLIGLVLVQQGQGADAGATFGGGSNTVFGASGANNAISRTTTITAMLFMLTSILLVKTYNSGSISFSTSATDPLAGSIMDKAETTTPAADSSAATVATDEQAKDTVVEGTIVEDQVGTVVDSMNEKAEEVTEAIEGAATTETDEIPLAETFPVDEETN